MAEDMGIPREQFTMVPVYHWQALFQELKLPVDTVLYRALTTRHGHEPIDNVQS